MAYLNRLAIWHLHGGQVCDRLWLLCPRMLIAKIQIHRLHHATSQRVHVLPDFFSVFLSFRLQQEVMHRSGPLRVYLAIGSGSKLSAIVEAPIEFFWFRCLVFAVIENNS